MRSINEAMDKTSIPCPLCSFVLLVLERDVNKAFARITGGKVNRGAKYGLEIPCVYQFYGPKPDIDKLRIVIDSLKKSGLVKFTWIDCMYKLLLFTARVDVLRSR